MGNRDFKADKEFKYTRVFIGGNPPRTKKEKEKVYQYLEVTGFFKRLFASSEVIFKEKR